MNKIYLLCMSLTLLNPCFAEDLQADSAFYESDSDFQHQTIANDQENSSTNQTQAQQTRAERKKALRKKRVVFGTEDPESQKRKNFSERLSTNKKSTQPSSQNQQLAKEKNLPTKQPDSKNAIASSPTKESPSQPQQQLNNKETSPTYDRHVRRQNHHSVSESSPKVNTGAEQTFGDKSNTGTLSTSAKQKSVDSKQSELIVQENQKDIQLEQTDVDQHSQTQQHVVDVGDENTAEPSQEETHQVSDTDSSQPHLEKCQTPFHVMHVGLRHTEAKGVGYKDGYTTLEGFGIYNENTDVMPFIDLRGHVFDNGKFAGNVGLGGRTFFPSFEHVLGYYLYYDVRQDEHNLTGQQVSPGIELLGNRMEYRVNGYFPVGNRKSRTYHADFDEFDGHHILIKTKQRRVLTGGDAEVGAHLTQSTKYDVYAGAGPYYFSSSHTSAWGGKVRLLGRFKEYVSLEAAYSYDHLFGSIIQGTVALNLPFGKKIKRKGKDCSSEINLALARAAFSPYRFEIPVIKKVSRKKEAINPATGDPWVVWFVNNTSSSDGTFESPFPTLVQAQNASGPNDMIYVFPGDGTTTGMDMGITLQNGQAFFGSGISHRIKTTKGRITIPAFSNSSPLITNVNGDVVTLASGNQVSGMNILVTAAGTNGIRGVGINGATINNNAIIGNVDYRGIDIIGFGDVTVKNNHVISLLTPLASTLNGIFLEVQDGTFMKANISNNFVNGFINAIALGPVANPTTARVDATIANNFATNFANDGVFYFTGMPNSTVRILGNAINNTIGTTGGARAGISVSVNNTSDTGTVLIQNNSVATTSANPGTIGILTEINNRITHLTANISDNTVLTGSGAGSTGINVRDGAGGTICATITDNTMIHQAAGTNDLQITASGGVINIDDISGNIASEVSISGGVNFVPAGTCE